MGWQDCQVGWQVGWQGAVGVGWQVGWQVGLGSFRIVGPDLSPHLNIRRPETRSRCPAMDFFPVSWSAGDTGPGATCRVTAFGKTPAGESGCVHIAFTPFFYVEAPAGFSQARCLPLLAQWAKRFGALADKCRVVMRRSIWGFRDSREQPYVQLVFGSLADFRRARYTLARETYDTYEAGIDPIIRLFHLRGLGPCRWMTVERWREPKLLVADVDVEVECSFTDVGPSQRADRPPLVFASECWGTVLHKFPHVGFRREGPWCERHR